MRKSRTPGSARGAGGNFRPYRDIPQPGGIGLWPAASIRHRSTEHHVPAHHRLVGDLRLVEHADELPDVVRLIVTSAARMS